MTKPISPSDIQKNIPDEVFAAFNREITENFRAGKAVVNQMDVARRLSVSMDLPVSQVIARGYLDVEDDYRCSGWIVKYEKSEIGMPGTAQFTFTDGSV